MMSNLAPQNDVLNLTPSKTSTTNSFSKTSKNKEYEGSDSKNSTQDDTESFLNSLLHAIDETNEFLPDHMKISQKEVVDEAINRLQKGVFDESDKISIFESASFMQILSLLDKLKTDTVDVKLANLSTQLSSLIKTEANFNALKGASNLSELLDIAKDLGLNVKNIKVDRLLDLKVTFPNLDKANFFKGTVDNVFKEIINNKISNVSKNLNHHLQNATHTTSAHFVQKTNSKDSGSLLSQTLKNLDSIFSFKESKHKKNDKNDELVKKLTEEQLNAKDTKQNLFEQKLNFENLNKTQVVQTKENNTNFNNNTHKEIFIQEQTHGENIDQNSLDELNSLVKDLNKVMQNNTRNITPKETLQHFSQDLKEAVEQYKAPITKLSITLNPNNLGEVEVTLIQRGNNLHINFNSNTNAMNLFIQNQTEFKNSLVNMGFTGLEMNFSDQGKREQNQNQGKNRSRYSFKDALDGKNEGEKINLELVLAKYF
ncbi:TPA: flagellar hook-length control protein FliK [Campylobacter jejuni]|nr:flagellar hook-length control protein FliK [Campylobacter jejuni]HDZ5019794.1 flagellar hook-length control protein FliK [Campylobacter jejuni]HDZ5049225.1 flagellar hook-length control protein FliK [Campylobacter jejuni]HDZ5054545.1 flagellar hook-length control protein FliK [Campylobacter jejuni]